MRLTLEQIRSVTTGSLRTEQKEDGIRFFKCTQKQIDAWHRRSDFLGVGAETTTGVRLDFHTTSKSIAFRASQGNKFELFVDGLLRKQFLMNAAENRTVSYPLTDPLGDSKESVRVTLHLPSHEVGILDWIELDDGAALTPHVFDCKMLFIGDSITQGWQSEFDTNSYAYRVSRHFNANSVIQGIGGAYYCTDTFDALPFDPDTVIVAYGTNDFGFYKTTDEMRTQAAAYLSLVANEYAGKRIFVISPIWRGTQSMIMGSFAQCRTVVKEESERLGLFHVDGLSLLPPLPTMYVSDLLHPNDLGFASFAENFIPQLL